MLELFENNWEEPKEGACIILVWESGSIRLDCWLLGWFEGLEWSWVREGLLMLISLNRLGACVLIGVLFIMFWFVGLSEAKNGCGWVVRGEGTKLARLDVFWFIGELTIF